jgi:hypothetical protein
MVRLIGSFRLRRLFMRKRLVVQARSAVSICERLGFETAGRRQENRDRAAE